jgi:hypothetical protein
MAIRRTVFAAAVIVWSATGCQLNAPGTIQQQRLRATIHDPYPDPDLGPEIDGGRPREYRDPLPEPVRNRIFVDSWWWRR